MCGRIHVVQHGGDKNVGLQNFLTFRPHFDHFSTVHRVDTSTAILEENVCDSKIVAMQQGNGFVRQVRQPKSQDTIGPTSSKSLSP